MNDAVLILLGYLYIAAVIVFSSRSERLLKCSRETSRKLLHILIGNLVFFVPLFDNWYSPVLVAAPFIPVTFLASPYSPVKLQFFERIGLRGLSESGDWLGLVFYACAYTILAGVFFDRPQVVAAGIIPMTFGDGAAALVGRRFGSRKFRFMHGRSLEGSIGFFAFSFLGLAIYVGFLSLLQVHPLNPWFVIGPVVAAVGAVVEALTPKGVDNLAVPLLCVMAAKFLGEW